MTVQQLETRGLEKQGDPEAAARAELDVGRTSTGVDRAVSVFLPLRPRLFRIAHRILSDPGQAEDVVQEVWIRWQGTDRSNVRDPTALLVTTTRRLAINVAQSAWNRRETTSGPSWLEPVEHHVGPAAAVETAQAVELAVLVMLQRLTAAQRAAYVLRHVFDYPYGRISETLHLEAAYARQLVRRAQLGVASGRRRAVRPGEHRRLVQAFLAAARAGDLGHLERVLVEDMAA